MRQECLDASAASALTHTNKWGPDTESTQVQHGHLHHRQPCFSNSTPTQSLISHGASICICLNAE